MIKFSVTLNKFDLKQFIFNQVKKQFIKVLWQPIIYLIAAMVLAILSIFLNYKMGMWIIILSLLILSFVSLYKFILTFKKLFIRSLSLVGKNRIFTVDRRCIQIIYGVDMEFCDRYFLYDFKFYELNSNYLFLYFNNNVYIIIPLRFLNEEQIKEFKIILDKAQN